MKDFFISYNKADRGRAEWIDKQLRGDGYSVIIQTSDFGPGSNFVLEMDSATREAERTIAVLSPDYLTALFTHPEWAAAFAADPTGKKRKLIPVRVRECQPTGLLAQIVYIDLVGHQDAVARRLLLDGVQQRTQRPPAPPRAPNSLPGIWNVPHLRNRNFTGREEMLKELRAALTSGRAAAIVPITGLGGAGKTQLVIEYAYRHTADYEIVWWVRAEEPVTLTADYANLATELCLPEKDLADQQATAAAVRSWLGHNPAGCSPWTTPAAPPIASTICRWGQPATSRSRRAIRTGAMSRSLSSFPFCRARRRSSFCKSAADGMNLRLPASCARPWAICRWLWSMRVRISKPPAARSRNTSTCIAAAPAKC